MQFISVRCKQREREREREREIMHINKLSSYTSQFKLNMFHKLYHFNNARTGFNRSVPMFRKLPYTDPTVYSNAVTKSTSRTCHAYVSTYGKA